MKAKDLPLSGATLVQIFITAKLALEVQSFICDQENVSTKD